MKICLCKSCLLLQFRKLFRLLPNPEEHQKTERWLLLGGVRQKGPCPKPAPNKPIYWQTSQGLNSQDPELLSGSNQVSGPRWHVGGWDPGWTERSGCGWGEPSDIEGGWGDPHQHSFLDVRFPRSPEKDYSRLSKGESGLICSQPDALLQLQQVRPHEPTLQGCCEVSGWRKRYAWSSMWGDPSCALIAMVPTFHRLKIGRCGRRRRRFNVSALRNAYPFRKPDSWLKPRWRLLFLEVRPTPLPPEESPNLLNVRHL